MKLIRVATSTVNQTPLDWLGNHERLIQCIDEAKDSGVSLLCLPELAITGYGCEDQFLATDTTERALDSLEALIPHCAEMIVAVGLPLRYQNTVYNVVAVIADAELLGFYAKQNLAGDGLHYEQRWFRPWPTGEAVQTEIRGDQVALGDILFEIGGVKIGLEVCEDAWVANRPGRRYAERGVDIILNPSASHFAFGKQEIREQFVQEGSRAFGVTYIYANLTGNEAGRAIYDGGSMVATRGHIVAQGKRLSFLDHIVTDAVVDIDLNRLVQAKTISRDIDLASHPTVQLDFDWPAEGPPSGKMIPSQWSKEQEFTHALTLGLYDYMRKSHSRGFVVSLSGGADSAAITTLIYLMHVLSKRELGDKVAGPSNMKDLLICVYQASKNSGEVTRNAANTLADALGAEYSEWQIQDAVDHYISQAEKTIGRQLSWQQDDLTLQNIQARVRAPGVWMLANIRGALLVSTSNRSEAAVGYATMDGDTSGGISPIAGIDKAYLREWLVWLEKEGCDEIEKIPALSVINAQQPTAELRPADQAQTDESDLMPYPVLDKIEKLAIRDKQSPIEIYQLIQFDFPQYSKAQLKGYVTRFFTLWSRNQWKRERYAPSFHLDDENLDPKTWCRFPILSGGFQLELSELEAFDDGE
ncbi:NAD(+) synthase [Persicirhabdus sediminis]|uniref:Glutamine-dependent NAD(+) synthetase n=1 Tax=Persicirhabdus sediminis TaxID=454144 RepID=A0A8J7M9U3_9BACT|nr:NAD(+) synthase [Persicirhabdus sediminis]MBK1789564.1 NAD(+) synthase [Persicirhabdus sediminis]